MADLDQRIGDEMIATARQIDVVKPANLFATVRGRVRRRRHRRRGMVALGCLVVVVVASTLAVRILSDSEGRTELVTGDQSATSVPVPADQITGPVAVDDDSVWVATTSAITDPSPAATIVVRLDPDGGAATSTRVSGALGALAADGSQVWGVDSDANELVRVDSSGDVDRVPLGSGDDGVEPASVAVSAAGILVLGTTSELIVVNPNTLTISARIELPNVDTDQVPGPAAIAVRGSDAWVARGPLGVTRVDVATRRVLDTMQVMGAGSPLTVSHVEALGEAIWVGGTESVSPAGAVVVIDPTSGALMDELRPGHLIAAGDDIAWIAAGEGLVTAQLEAGRIATTEVTDFGADDLWWAAAGHGVLWYTGPASPRAVVRVDASTGDAIETQIVAAPDFALIDQVSGGYVSESTGGTRLVVSDDSHLTVIDVDEGTTRATLLPELAPGDPPARLARLEGGVAFYGRVGTYWMPPDLAAPPRRLSGPSGFFVPGSGGDSLWLAFQAQDGSVSGLRRVDAGGAILDEEVGPAWPLAATDLGPLYPAADLGLTDGGIALWTPGDPAPTPTGNPGSFVIAADADGFAAVDNESVVWITDLNSGRTSRFATDALAAEGTFVSAGAFSPDGSRLAIAAGQGDGPGRARIIDIASGQVEVLDGAGVAEFPNPVWSADGRWVFWPSADSAGIVAHQVGTDRTERLSVMLEGHDGHNAILGLASISSP